MLSKLPSTAALQCFRASARTLSVSRAAAELHLTQSAVSRQIKNLEAYLDVQLFERVKQRLQLTDSGRHYLHAITPLLDQLEEVTADVKGSIQRLRIAAEPAFTSRWLIPRLKGFRQRFPHIEITILTHNEPLEHVDGFDVAFVYGAINRGGFTTEKVLDEELIAVCAPELLTGSGQFAGYQGITEYPVLHHCASASSTALWFAAAGLDSRAHPGQYFDHFALLVDAAIQGMGVTVVPSFFVKDELKSGTLMEACQQRLSTGESYFLAVANDKLGSKNIVSFQQWIHNARV